MLHEESTKEVIGAAFEVYNHLGYGFLGKVYQRAMKVELDLRSVPSALEAPIKVMFKGQNAGDYFADIFVDEKVLVELKVAKEYNSSDEAQLLNELKATGVHPHELLPIADLQFVQKRVVLDGGLQTPWLARWWQCTRR